MSCSFRCTLRLFLIFFSAVLCLVGAADDFFLSLLLLVSVLQFLLAKRVFFLLVFFFTGRAPWTNGRNLIFYNFHILTGFCCFWATAADAMSSMLQLFNANAENQSTLFQCNSSSSFFFSLSLVLSFQFGQPIQFAAIERMCIPRNSNARFKRKFFVPFLFSFSFRKIECDRKTENDNEVDSIILHCVCVSEAVLSHTFTIVFNFSLHNLILF